MAETIGLRAVIDLSNFNKGLSSYNKGINRMNKKTSGFTSGATKQFAKLGGGLLKFGAIAGGAALVGVAALTAGLVAFGASAVKEGTAYTKAMSNVKAVTGATAEEFEALSASAEELGRTTKFTAIEAAEGMSFLAMAGFEVNEVIGAMPGVLNLAAAGNLELGQSADIVSNILTGFGAEVDQTGRFVDVLTKTFTSSNTNLVQLGSAMKFVAPVAADLGLSVEQTAAAMGVLGDGGIQASMAGTTLRTALLNLAAPVGKGKTLIKELGIEVFDAEGKMLPFPEIIGNFNEAMEGMSDAQRQTTLRTIIGKRAISGFSLLLKKGEKGLEDFGQDLLNSVNDFDGMGTAAGIAATQLDNLSGDMTLLKSALSGIKIDVFKALEPILRGVVGQGKILLETFGPQLTAIFTNAITSVTDFIKKVMGAFQRFGLRGAAISILGQLGLSPDQIAIATSIADKIVGVINKVSGAFERFGIRGATISILGLLGLGPEQIAGVLGAVDQTIEAINKISGAFERFGVRGAAISILGVLGLEPETIGFILSAVDTIIMAITNLVTGITDILGGLSFDEVIGGLTGIGAVLAGGLIIGAITAVSGAIFALLTPINLIIAAAALLGVAWAGNWGNIQGITAQAITAITNLFNTAFPIIQAVVLTAGAVISSVFAGIMGVIIGQVVPNLQAAFANITMALGSLGISWSDVWDAVLTAMGIVAAAIGAILLALVSVIVGVVAGISAAILTATEVFLSLQSSVGRIIGGITQILTGFVGFWTAIFAGDLTGAFEAWKLQLTGLVTFVGGIFELILNAITLPLLTATSFLSGFVTSIITFFTGLSNSLVGNSIIPDMVQSIIDTFTGMIEPILSVFSTLSEGIASVLGAIFGGGAEEAQAPTMAFNPAEMLVGIEAVNLGIESINLALSNITLLTLPLLSETFLIITTAIIEQFLLLLTTGIMPVDLALVTMTTVTLPNLQTTSDIVTLAMVAGFTTVNSILSITIDFLGQIVIKLGEVTTAAEKTVKALSKIGEENEVFEDMIELLRKATSFANKLATALADVASRQAGVGGALAGIGFSGGAGMAQGMGFQAGTPANTNGLLGLGFRIPPGFPNDSFGPIFAQSGEEMLITPRGTSIEGLVFSRLAALLRGTSVQGGGVTNNITNIEMNMNLRTTSSARANVQQFEIQRGLLGV